MSDRSFCVIKIGGSLPKGLIEELARAIVDEGAGRDCGESFDIKGAEDYIRQASWEHTFLELKDDQASGGEMEDLEFWCRAHKLSYHRHTAAHYTYDSVIEVWKPRWKKPRVFYSNEAGQALVSFDDIRDFLKNKGRTINDLILHLERMSADPPPITIIEDETTP